MLFCEICMYALYVPCRRSISPLRRLQRVFHILTPSIRAIPVRFSIVVRDWCERRRAHAQCAPPVSHPLAPTATQHGSRTAMSNDDDGRDVQPVRPILVFGHPPRLFLLVVSGRSLDELSRASFETTAGTGQKPRSDARTSEDDWVRRGRGEL